MEQQIKALIRRGCAVCIFVQEPASLRKDMSQLTSKDEDVIRDFERYIEELQSWNAHVTQLPKTHQKFAIIDGTKLWEGSLNILCHHDGVEHMRRFDSSFEVNRVKEKHGLDQCVQCAALRDRYFVSTPDVDLQLKMIGHAISTHRKVQKHSLRSLSIASGVTFQRIGQIENTKHLSALAPVLQLLNALDLRMVICQKEDVASLLNAVDLAQSREFQ
jgi:hypothetical protein